MSSYGASPITRSHHLDRVDERNPVDQRLHFRRKPINHEKGAADTQQEIAGRVPETFHHFRVLTEAAENRAKTGAEPGHEDPAK